MGPSEIPYLLGTSNAVLFQVVSCTLRLLYLTLSCSCYEQCKLRWVCLQQLASGSVLGKHPFKISLAHPPFRRSTQLMGTFSIWGSMPSSRQLFVFAFPLGAARANPDSRLLQTRDKHQTLQNLGHKIRSSQKFPRAFISDYS